MAITEIKGKDVWAFIRTGVSTVIPIKCLTTVTVTASQEVSNTDTKCGRKKAAQGDPDYQVSGEGLIQKLTGVDVSNNYTAKDLFNMITLGQSVDLVIGPASGTPVEGDVTYSGKAIVSEWEATYPSAEDSTFSFTFEIDGALLQEVEPTP